MKLLITGDWHLTDKSPENRIDNYEQSVLRKLEFIIDTASKEKVELIIQPGDFTDTPSMSYSMFIKVIKIIKNSPIFIATVFGQHDLRYRNKDNTAMLAIDRACPNVLLGLNEYYQSPVFIHSAGWEDPIPKPLLKAFNILITHRMIIDNKLWEGQEDCETGNTFLKQHKFDLIVSGDNHQYFYVYNSSSVIAVQCTDKILMKCSELKTMLTL